MSKTPRIEKAVISVTPRTDEYVKARASLAYSVEKDTADFARHLERELAEVRKQRDALAQACKNLMKVIGSPDDSPEDCWATEDEINDAWHAGNEAIAIVKGGDK